MMARASPGKFIPIEVARWRLALIWFPFSALIFILLIAQSIGGAFGGDLQRVWGWAMPNFLPTISLMLSVFGADALKPASDSVVVVRKGFFRLSCSMSLFYLVIFLLTILVQPSLQLFGNGDDPIAARLKLLETSNIWLGPLQAMVVAAIGVVFFLKEEGAKED
jgi:hypothetical protein